MPYYAGEPVPLTWNLTDKDGNPVQAASTPPVLTVTEPGGATVTPSLAYMGSQYVATGPSPADGHYEVSWVCEDATYPGSFTDSYDVWPGTETSILSMADAKRALRISPADTTNDDFVIEFARTTTSIIEWWCGPVNVRTVVEELRVGGLVTILSYPPVIELVPWTEVPEEFSADTSRTVPSPPSPMFPVMVFGVTYPMANLYAAPGVKGGRVRHTSGLPFYYGPYLWQYSAGRPVVPECITTGAKIILKHIYGLERGGAAGGSQAAAADEETTETPFGFAVPNRALEVMVSEALPGAIA